MKQTSQYRYTNKTKPIYLDDIYVFLSHNDATDHVHSTLLCNTQQYYYYNVFTDGF